ncbi:MAG: outer membrane lipoprotein LolB [Proteobacteria bacterium]|nr:MAG: outer membrane lipoprotein LolB [Pseudomonadota bacterium]
MLTQPPITQPPGRNRPAIAFPCCSNSCSASCSTFLFLAAVLTTLLSACSTNPEITTPSTLVQPEDWNDRMNRLHQLENWSVYGKIGVRSPDQSDSAVINEWKQAGDLFRIKLSSALFGIGATILEGSDEELFITRSDGEIIHSRDPEQLLRTQTGWQVPLTSIPCWIKGIPSPQEEYSITFDNQGNPHTIIQSGWRITPGRYKKTDEMYLPGKIVISNTTNKITLIIARWTLTPP